MARIVLGIGTSHTPMLNARLEDWPRFIELDRLRQHLDKEGRPVTYEELLALAGDGAQRELQPEVLAARWEAAMRHVAALGEVLRRAELDTLVVVGDDQKELFQTDNQPSILVYHGTTIRNVPLKDRSGPRPPWAHAASARYYEPETAKDYPVDAAMALHLVNHLVEHDFDVSVADHLPGDLGEGHAFGFVHRRLLDGRDLPVLPIFLNTYYPPNQPTPRRCFTLGQRVRQAIESWPDDRRVGRHRVGRAEPLHGRRNAGPARDQRIARARYRSPVHVAAGTSELGQLRDSQLDLHGRRYRAPGFAQPGLHPCLPNPGGHRHGPVLRGLGLSVPPKLRLVRVEYAAAGIHLYEFRDPEGAPLPAFEAGAHVDLHLGNGQLRQYSLLNAVGERHRYVVGIKRDPDSRGGSAWVHEVLRVGDMLPVSAPRCHFPLDETRAHSLLIGGGIGITPLACMVQRLREIGRPYTLYYSVRRREEAALLDLLAGPELHLHVDEERGRPARYSRAGRRRGRRNGPVLLRAWADARHVRSRRAHPPRIGLACRTLCAHSRGGQQRRLPRPAGCVRQGLARAGRPDAARHAARCGPGRAHFM
jgi:3-O-methylgallate 3,4-dioxygenase